MQKFRSKRDKVNLPKKGQLKKIQDKRKKPKVSDDAEIEKLSSILWPNFDEEKKASSSAHSISCLHANPFQVFTFQ